MIIISGCSWAVGEWEPDPHTNSIMLSGPGIGQLFGLHGKVVNLSEGGSSNTEQLTQLKEFLNKFTPDQDDIFYWIVTDPLRCAKDNNLIAQLLDKYSSIDSLVRSILDSFLDAVNQLAIKHNIHINLIGGACDLDTVDVKKYTQLSIAVPSWGKLMDSTYASSIFFPQHIAKLGNTVRDKKPELIDEWIQISNLAIQKRDSLENLFKNNLSNDKWHPNRYGHRILRDFLDPEYSYKF